MTTVTTLESPNIRTRHLGIGQPQRLNKARQVGDTTKPLLRAALDHYLVKPEENRKAGTHPLQALEQATENILQLLWEAVAHSVVITVEPGKKITAPVLQNLQQMKRGTLGGLLPPFTKPQPSAELASRWPDAACVSGLCLADPLFISFRDQVVETLALYVSDLVDAGLLGFIIECDATQAAYSYVIRAVEISPTSVTRQPTIREYNADAPPGLRTTYTTTTDAAGKSRHTTQEHVHHLTGSQTIPLTTFTQRPPQRIVEFRKSIPNWVIPFLAVTEGTIVREEIHTMDEYHTQWQTSVSTAIKASPAISLGDLVLAGWSDTDFTVEAQTRQAAEEKSSLGGFLLSAAALGVLVFVFRKL